MKVTICAVGRLRGGPERALLDDYCARFDRTGRQLGLGPVAMAEVEDRKRGGATAEAVLLERACPAGAVPIYRMFNNGQTGSPNHRFTTSPATYQQFTTAQGWAGEGVVFCAPQ